MRSVALGEIGKIVSGATPKTGMSKYWNGQIPWVTPADLSDHDGIYYRGKPKRITQAGLESCSATMLPSNSILFSSRAPIGHCALSAFPVCTNQGFKNIVPNERLDPLYGYFALKFITPDIIAKGRGATFGEVTKEIMEEVRVPYCDVREQKRIATLLEQADRLRRARRYALELCDTLLPAAFLEFFGDPSTNPKGWRSVCLGDVLLSAQDGPHVSPEYCERGIPFLSTRNVRAGEVLWDDLKYISLDDAEQHWRKVKPARGDILYTKGGTTGLAKAVDFDYEVAVWVHIAVLKIRRELVVPAWLENMLNSAFCYRQSQELTFGIVNRDLGLKRMPNIRIYLPPIAIQERFADISKRFEHQRAIEREALRQADHLFQSLLHRAFSENG